MKEDSLVKFIVVFVVAAKLAVIVLPTLIVGLADWLIPIFISTLYILIGAFLLRAANSLKDYNIDSASILLFLLFGTMLRFDTIPSNTVGLVLKALAWGMCAAVLAGMLARWISAAHTSPRQIAYVVIGIIAAIFIATIEAYVIIHKPGFGMLPEHASFYFSADYLERSIAFEASNAAVPEEFIFRGLFWGYLVRQSGSEKKACMIQGLVFWLTHLDTALVSPVAFWLLFPAFTILSTVLAWRSRSLSSSIIAHTTYSVFQVILAVVLAGHV